jgi:choline dehydrogenase-like flavoprotein/predicted dehydrogenase
MRFFDLRELDENSVIETDICIIGTGPTGLAIARELAGTHIDVLVLESGGLEYEEDTQSLYEIQNVGRPRCIDQTDVRRRVFGGSSTIWTGRCAPFDDIDFEKRPWIDYSGWPLTRSDLDPYLERAGAYLGLGPHCYDDRLWSQFGRSDQPKPLLDHQFLEPIFWQFSKSRTNPQLSADVGRDLTFPNSPNLSVLLHANATHIHTNPDGTAFESVETSTLEKRRGRVRAKALVLGCGGIENARLLLASNSVMPQGLGNQHDLVGRFLMDHPLCVLGHFNPEDAANVRDRFGLYWLRNQQGLHNYTHGVTLSDDIQRKEKLLRCNAYIEEFDIALDDPWDALYRVASGVKSKRISRQTLQDGRAILSNSGELTKGLYRRIAKNRYQLRRAQRVELHCLLEQMPDPESRVTLSMDQRDRLGLPISKINWKISDLERHSANRMGQLICQEFQRLKLPTPTLHPISQEGDSPVFQFMDKAHPTGTTRLSLNPKDGVVDQNLQVHGIQGLFVAGSSVFPTSGAANPTLMIVAVALRLADRLKELYDKPVSRSVSPSAPSTASPLTVFPMVRDRPNKSNIAHKSAPIKVGIIGSGQRISEVYLPILNSLPGSYGIVGFTTPSTQSSRRFESKTGIQSFENAAELVNQQQPSFLITAVPSQVNDKVLMELLDLKIPIFTETPLAWSTASGMAILQKAAANGIVMGVAEQFPYFPLEQFKQKLLDLGLFGDVYAAYNDFCSYSYHGMAQLRRYLKGNPKNARSMDYQFGRDPHRDSSEKWADIQWQVGSVSFDSNAMLFYNYSDHHTESKLCLPQETRLYGKSGTMTGSNIQYFDRTSGQIEAGLAVRNYDEQDRLASISATLPGLGYISWENPYVAHPFTDEQIAVATLLEGMSQAVLTGCPPLYTADEFLDNVAIMQAFRFSSQRNGASIPLPFNEKRQKLLSKLDVGRWKRKLFRT